MVRNKEYKENQSTSRTVVGGTQAAYEPGLQEE